MPSNVVLRDAVPANTTYVAGSTTPERRRGRGCRAALSPLVNGMLIHSPANPTPGSMPADASGSPANVATITFDVVVNPNVARRHGDLEPGLRHRRRQRHRRPAVRRPGHADRQRSDARHRRQPARCSTPRSASRCSSIWARRASSIRATCCATRSPCRTPPRSRDRRRPDRRGSGEHDLRREFHAAERAAGRPAGRRRLAARLGHQHRSST